MKLLCYDIKDYIGNNTVSDRVRNLIRFKKAFANRIVT